MSSLTWLVVVGIVLSLAACERSHPAVRSDALDEALAMLNDFGSVVAYQIPLRRRTRPPAPKIQTENFPQLHKRSGAVYSVPYTTIDSEAWAIPINIGATNTSILVDLDTGSSDLYVSGPLCPGCTPGPSFVESPSYTDYPCPSAHCNAPCYVLNSQPVCNFTTCYGLGGASGVIGTDTFGIPGIPKRANVTFGNLYDAQGLSCRTQSNLIIGDWGGIMGAAFGNLSSIPLVTKTSLDLLIEANNLTNVFSLCTLTENAYMSIGSDYSCNTEFVYVPIIQDAFYAIEIFDMGTDGASFGLTNDQLNMAGYYVPTIVDSGTTELILNNEISTAFVDSLLNLCSQGVNLVGFCGIPIDNATNILNGFSCYNLTTQDLDAYPSLYITIDQGYTITLQGSDYLVPYVCPFPGYTSFLAVFQNISTILGDTFMQKQHVVFDKANNRLGFGPVSTCNFAAATCSCKLSLPACLLLTYTNFNC